MKIINENIILSDKITELLNFLKFSFYFQYERIGLFTIVNEKKEKKYDILFNIEKNNNFIMIDQEIITKKNETHIIITEKLLVELYSQGASIYTVFKKYLKGEFKTKKFNYKKFNSFLSNFNFSEECWKKFYQNKINNLK